MPSVDTRKPKAIRQVAWWTLVLVEPASIIIILLLLKLYLHTVFSSGFNMQHTKLDKYKSRTH